MDSLIMVDKHLDTILETESDEFIKSSVENLVQNPRESEDEFEDSDSLIDLIDLFLYPDDSIPPGIESDDYDLEGDILFLEELLSNDSLSLPETESFNFGHYDVPSSTMASLQNHYPGYINTLLPFSSENKDKVFNPGILSSPLLSHRGKFTSDFSESPMMISGGNIPLLDVPFLYFYPP
ncbi:hypothetical protein Tco_0720180 [Tanacetum coccineum]